MELVKRSFVSLLRRSGSDSFLLNTQIFKMPHKSFYYWKDGSAPLHTCDVSKRSSRCTARMHIAGSKSAERRHRMSQERTSAQKNDQREKEDVHHLWDPANISLSSSASRCWFISCDSTLAAKRLIGRTDSLYLRAAFWGVVFLCSLCQPDLKRIFHIN